MDQRETGPVLLDPEHRATEQAAAVAGRSIKRTVASLDEVRSRTAAVGGVEAVELVQQLESCSVGVDPEQGATIEGPSEDRRPVQCAIACFDDPGRGIRGSPVKGLERLQARPGTHGARQAQYGEEENDQAP